MQPIEVSGEPELLSLQLPANLQDFFVLSPFVTFGPRKYEMLLRLVNQNANPSKKVSRIHYATSDDGLTFAVGSETIGPGSAADPDGAGCEDPTVVREETLFRVFYSGYSAQTNQSSMLSATGQSLAALLKTGQVLPYSSAYANPKEAALILTTTGYRMFFEYARDGASHIGAADAPTLAGPWVYANSPIKQRVGEFDSWHLSPSSAIRRTDGTHVLFYNGSSKETAWRVNYVLLNCAGTAVLERPAVPLVSPSGLEPGETDIAFAASAIIDPAGDVWLYYSIADRRPYRCRLVIEGALCDSALAEPKPLTSVAARKLREK